LSKEACDARSVGGSDDEKLVDEMTEQLGKIREQGRSRP
jgi:hypothetical protein